MIRIGAVTFGRMWVAMMRRSRQPMAWAASTNLFCFADSTAPRTMRELPGMITTAIASIAFVVLGRSTDTMARARRRPGIVFTASITRWSTMSSRPSQ